MEALKNYIRNNIIFDYHDDENGENFDRVLFDELDRIGIYASDNREFFNIDPDKVIHLAVAEHFIIDVSTTIDDIVRKAQDHLCFCYMYSELKKAYLAKFDAPTEDAKK